MKKVFVSSTVFDLLDVRSEVECLLREMRLVPVLSGSASSAFQPATDQNSIETCLVNLRQSDFVIVILCQRYGPSLKGAGFDDLSATHLEYIEAKRLGKPIRMYVRDRLEADYAVYKRNKRTNPKLVWVRDEPDQRLFELLEQHRQLAKDSEGSNWFDTFRDSIELKSLLKRDFGPIASRSDLESLVIANKVPMISVSVTHEPVTPGSSRLSIRVVLKNVGIAPAYKVSWKIDELDCRERDAEVPVLAPQQEIQQSLTANASRGEYNMQVTYFMAQGHRVLDICRVGFHRLGGPLIPSGAKCLSRKYVVAPGGIYPFTIEDAEQSDN